jgi:hypothetical protein
MQMFQVAIAGHEPQGGYFKTRAEAEREVRYLQQDDARYAAEALEQAGIVVAATLYEVVPVTL